MFYITSSDINYSNMFNDIFQLDKGDVTTEVDDNRKLDSTETLLDLIHDPFLHKNRQVTCVYGHGEEDSWYCLLSTVAWKEKRGSLVSDGSKCNECMIREISERVLSIFCIGIMKNHLTSKTIISVQRSDANPSTCFDNNEEFDKIQNCMRSVLFDLHSTFYSPRNEWRRFCDLNDVPYIIGLELDPERIAKFQVILSFNGDGDISRDNLLVVKHKVINYGYLHVKFRMLDIMTGDYCEFIDKSDFLKKVNTLIESGMSRNEADELVKKEAEEESINYVEGDIADDSFSDDEVVDRGLDNYEDDGWGEEEIFDEDTWRNIDQD